MIKQTRDEKIKEVEFQTQMLHNLSKWIRNLIIFSSLMVAIAYWAIKLKDGPFFNFLGGTSIVMIIVSTILCIVIGLGYKNGKNNLGKIKSAL